MRYDNVGIISIYRNIWRIWRISSTSGCIQNYMSGIININSVSGSTEVEV